MRTITHTFNVYRYNELDADAKDYAKQQYLELPFRAQEFSALVEIDLEVDYPNSDLKFQYSLSSCQGDGFNVYGLLNLKDVLKYEESAFSDREIKTLEEYFEYEEFAELKQNCHYSYSLADQNDYVGKLWNQLTWNDVDVDEVLLSKLDQVACSHVEDLCRRYEERGYEFLYEISDEDMAFMSEENDYEYLEDGSFYRSELQED